MIYNEVQFFHVQRLCKAITGQNEKPKDFHFSRRAAAYLCKRLYEQSASINHSSLHSDQFSSSPHRPYLKPHRSETDIPHTGSILRRKTGAVLHASKMTNLGKGAVLHVSKMTNLGKGVVLHASKMANLGKGAVLHASTTPTLEKEGLCQHGKTTKLEK